MDCDWPIFGTQSGFYKLKTVENSELCLERV